MPPSKNWHWKNARAESYAKQWLTDEILKIETEGLKLNSVHVEGDCEVGMRKSKIITVFDLVVKTEWTGADDVKGTLTCPELMHDMAPSEYIFESELTSGSGASANQSRQLARTQLADSIRLVFDRFTQALLARYSFLLTDEAPANNELEPAAGSGTSTPSAGAAAGAAVGGSSAATPSGSKSSAFRTASVKTEADLHVTAADLFELLTDGERKVPMWSRNPSSMKPVVGADVELFGGNIRGTVKSVDKPKGFVMSWRAPTWPKDHYGELTVKIDQLTDTTKLTLALSGVPAGSESDTERNLETFYIRSLKSIGQVEEYQENWEHRPALPDIMRDVGLKGFVLAGVLPVLLSLGLIGALVAAILAGPTFR